MATIGTLKTLVDWSKEVDPDGSTSAVAELLSQENGIVKTMLFKEGNLPTGDRVSQRTGLPTSYWRMVNMGTPSSKATSAQVDISCGTLTARSEIDRKIVDLNGNTAQYRLSETSAHMESMNQEFAATSIYGTASNPEEFVGLAAQYNDTSAANGQNILLGGGSGSDNSSIWLVGWGDNAIYGVFPKGSKAGLSHENLGLIDAFDSSNNRFRAYADSFEWDGAVVVKDWRYGVRIPNIDISELVAQTGSQASTAATAIIKLMSRAIDRIHSMSGVKPCFYVNRTVASHLRIAALDKSNAALSVQESLNQFGQTIFTTTFLGVPVEIEDALTITEDLVS